MNERRQASAGDATSQRGALALVLAGCGSILLSIVLPVMRWNVSDLHGSAGTARAFIGDGWRLIDGGFPGATLAPFAAACVVPVAVAAWFAARDRWMWWLLLVAAVLLAYYPLWVLYVFLKKLEDQVFPASGVLALVAGSLAIGLGVRRLGAGHLTRPNRSAT